MGEIADALRRARAADSGPRPAPSGRRIFARPELTRPAQPPAASAEVSAEAAGNWFGRAVVVEPKGAVAQYYRHAAIRLSRQLQETSRHVLAVSSAARAEGKTTTACNLALALAAISPERRIALVDLDLRRPAVARALGIRPQVGLEAVLAGRETLDRVCVGTHLGHLEVYPVRTASSDPLELITGAALSTALRDLGSRYDLVIVDTPPILPVPDVPLILEHVQAILLVARAGASRSQNFNDVMAAIPQGRLIGSLLNFASRSRRRHYYEYAYEESASPDSEDANDAEES